MNCFVLFLVGWLVGWLVFCLFVCSFVAGVDVAVILLFLLLLFLCVVFPDFSHVLTCSVVLYWKGCEGSLNSVTEGIEWDQATGIKDTDVITIAGQWSETCRTTS